MLSELIGKTVGILPEAMKEKVAKFLVYHFIFKKADLRVNGIERCRGVKAPIIFISNHLSNADGVVLNEVLKEFDPTFVAGIKLSKNSFTKLGIYAVKTTLIKPDTADKEGLTRIVNIAKEGGNIVIFPEGTRSRNGKMIKAKKGFYLIAKLTKATIIPIGLWGTENVMPINDEGMEKEAINRAKVYVNIGEPFNLRPKDKEEDKKQYEDKVTDECMMKIAELLPESYRGEYNL